MNHLGASAQTEFQSGGPLRETAVYVERSADKLLRDRFETGRFCYILASRQVGKTSLVKNVSRKLHSQGSDVRVVEVDLSTIGSNVSEAEWFFTLAYQVAEKLDCECDLHMFWAAFADQTPAHRWTQFLVRYLPDHLKGKLVLVLDEVSAVLALPFCCDPFFATIRSVGEHYKEHFTSFRLSFCMLGVAAPSDLLHDQAFSPFNTEGQVFLGDFSRKEFEQFLPPLKDQLKTDAEFFLEAIFGWTCGQPYMTQRLCALLAEQQQRASGAPEAQIKTLAEETFLRDGRIQDAVLSHVERFISKDQGKLPQDKMLDLYRSILDAKASVPSEPGNPEEAYLKLSGLIATDEDARPPSLRPRNRIFAEVFNLRWVREKETELFLGTPVRQWRKASPREQEHYLLRGEALERALRWAHTHDPSREEARFLLESDNVARELVEKKAKENDIRLKLEVAKAELERAKSRQRSRISLIVAAAMVSAVGLWTYGYVERSELLVREEKKRSELLVHEEKKKKRIVELLVQAFSKDASKPPEEILAAAIGLQAESPDALSGVQTALTRGLVEAMNLRTQITLRGHQGKLTHVVSSPDGERVLTGAEDGTARLWTVKTGASVVLERHEGAVQAVDFSEDGAIAATGDDGGVVRLWDGRTGKSLAVLPGHNKMVTVVAFSPGPASEARLVSTSDDGTVILRRARDGGDEVKLREHTKAINSARFSKDGRWLVTGGEDETVILWNVKDARVERRLQAKGILRSVAFSPNGLLVAAGGTDGLTRVWRTADGTLLNTLRNDPEDPKKKDEAQIWSIAFSHRGDKLVTVGLRGKVIVWDAKSGTAIATLGIPYDGKNVFKAIFSPDDGHVVTVCSDGLVRVWSASSGALVTVLRGHENLIVDLDFSSDGRYLVTASWDKTAKIWGARDERPLQELSAGAIKPEALKPLGALAYSSDGQRIAAAGDDGSVRIWNANGGASVLMHEPHHGIVNWVAFSPDAESRYLASASDDGTAHIYDVTTGKLTASLAHDRAVRRVIFSKIGGLAATSDDGGSIKIWRSEGGQWAERAIYRQEKGVSDIAFSPDATHLLSGDTSGVVRLWSTSDNVPPLEMQGHEGKVRSVAFSPDGRTIVTASNDKSARTWDTATGKLLHTLLGHSSNVLKAMFLSDGKHIVTASWDLSARIWDAGTGELSFQLFHTGPVTSLAASVDGRTLATTTGDGFLWLWDTGDHLGDLIAKLPGASGQVWKSAFSPDDKRIATVSEDGRLRIYATELDGFLTQACRTLEAGPLFAGIKDACLPHMKREP